MAKVGAFSYPDIRLSEAVEMTRRIATRLRGTVTVPGLAHEMGMAVKSGALFGKLAALREYGLVEGRGEVRITELARRLVSPADPEEETRAGLEALQRVELLQALWDRLGGELPDNGPLLVRVGEITRVAPEALRPHLPRLRKHLSDLAMYHQRLGQSHAALSAEPSTLSSAEYSVVDRVAQGAIPGNGRGERRIVVEAPDVYLMVPPEAEFVGIALDLLRLVQARMTASSRTG